MADDPKQPDPKQQQEYNKYADIGRKIAAEFTQEARDLSIELREHLGIRQKQNEYDKALLGLARSISTEATKNRVELGRQGQIQKQLTKDATTLSDAERERLLISASLSDQQIKDAQRIATIQKMRADALANLEQKNKEFLDAKGEEKELAKEALKDADTFLQRVEQHLDRRLKLADADVERLALADQLVRRSKEQLGASTAEAQIQDRINKSMGVTGTLIKSAKGAMDQLGMGSLGNLLNIDKANTELKEQIDLIERAAEVNGQIEYKGQKMSKAMAITSAKAGAFKNMLSGAFKSATSLEATIGFTLKSLLAASDTQAKFQKMTGMSATAAYGLKNRNGCYS